MNLTEDTIILYAAKNYINYTCGCFDEFLKDLEIPIYLKRLFGRYILNNNLRERLILNHLIIFYNVFTAEAATRMLFFNLDPKFYPALKSFLIFLQRWPEMMPGINLATISADTNVLNKLRKL